MISIWYESGTGEADNHRYTRIKEVLTKSWIVLGVCRMMHSALLVLSISFSGIDPRDLEK